MKAFKVMAALGLCAVIATGTARAQSKPGVWDVHHQNTTQAGATTQQQPGVLDHGRSHDRRPVVFGSRQSNQPAGWDHGRKTGWGNCNVPPGQARPAGCGPVVHHRERRWAQRRDRRWEQRRHSERREARRRFEHREARQHAERRHERVEMAHRGRHH